MKARLLSGLAVLVMIGFSVLSAGVLLEMRRETLRDATRTGHNLLVAEADDIDRTLSFYDLSMRSTARLLSEAALLGASPRLQQLGLFDQGVSPSYLGPIRVLDTSGRVTHDSTTLDPAPATAAERDALDRHRRDPDRALMLGRPFLDGTAAGGAIELSHRVFAPDGGFAGIVAASLHLSFPAGLLRRLRLGPGDVVNLLSADGTILAHAPGALPLGRSIAGSPNLRRMFDSPGGTFEGRSALDGTRRLYSFIRVGTWPLVLDVGLSEHDLYAPWRRRALISGVSLLVMVATGLFLLLALRTELKARIGAEGRYRLLAEHASDVIQRFDAALRLLYVSPSCQRYGYLPTDLLGGSPLALVHPQDRAEVHAALLAARTEDRDAEVSYRLRRSDGTHVWVEGRYGLLPGDGFIGIVRDISRRKEAEEALERANAELGRQALTDSLTGLANRRGFDQAFLLEWRRALRVGSSLSVLLVDVDLFKQFNDRYGHPAGDAALSRVASSIRDALRRPGDLAARYGGEEFAAILPATELFGAIDVAEAVRAGVAALELPHQNGIGGRITVSIGVATIRPGTDGTGQDEPPEDGTAAAAALLAAADAALYLAKQDGRNQVRARTAAAAAGAGAGAQHPDGDLT